MSNDITDYRDIFLNDRPMMDTRAPVEFIKGAFPGVIDLPLMTDSERQRVGTCYKRQGQQAADCPGASTGVRRNQGRTHPGLGRVRQDPS